jgi:hypothetical protein
MEDVGIVNVNLVFFSAIWYILRSLGIGRYIYYGYLVYFSRFGMLYKEKSGNPGPIVRRAFETIQEILEKSSKYLYWKFFL